jgi:hypothetical protein
MHLIMCNRNEAIGERGRRMHLSSKRDKIQKIVLEVVLSERRTGAEDVLKISGTTAGHINPKQSFSDVVVHPAIAEGCKEMRKHHSRFLGRASGLQHRGPASHEHVNLSSSGRMLGCRTSRIN